MLRVVAQPVFRTGALAAFRVPGRRSRSFTPACSAYFTRQTGNGVQVASQKTTQRP